MSNENKKGKSVFLPLDGFTSLTDGFETKDSPEEKPSTKKYPQYKKGEPKSKALIEGIAKIIKSLEEEDKTKDKKAEKKRSKLG